MSSRSKGIRLAVSAAYLRYARSLEETSPAVIAILLYALSAIVLLSFGFSSHFRADASMFEADEAEYLRLASNLLNDIWHISPRRTLGFPIIIATIRSASPSLIVLQIAVTCIFALSVPAMFYLARRLTNSNTSATLSSLLFTFWPAAIFYGTSLYSETVALPVFLIALGRLPAGTRIAGDSEPGTLGTILSGILLGLAAHIRPMYLLFLPILLLILFVEEKRIADAVRRFLIALAGFFLVVAPWSTYMTLRFDRLIILTANGGETLSGGLTPKLLEPAGQYVVTSGNRRAWVGPGKWVPIYENGYLSQAERARAYVEVDTLLQKRALAWASANPGKAMFLELRKLSYMWGIYPIAENGIWQGLLGNVPILALLAVTLAILVRNRSARTHYARLWMIALFVSGVALISWGSWRFRQPADAALLAFVGCVITTRARRFADTHSPIVTQPQSDDENCLVLAPAQT